MQPPLRCLLTHTNTNTNMKNSTEYNEAEQAFDEARRTRATEVKEAMRVLDVVGNAAVDILRMAGFIGAEYRVIKSPNRSSIRIRVVTKVCGPIARIFSRSWSFQSELDRSGNVSAVAPNGHVCMAATPEATIKDFARTVSRLAR